MLLCNLEKEQRRRGYSDSEVAEMLGISKKAYESRKKDGQLKRPQISLLLHIFHCSFEYLMEDSSTDERGDEIKR